MLLRLPEASLPRTRRTVPGLTATLNRSLVEGVVDLFLMAQLIGSLFLLMAFASMLPLRLPSGSRVNIVLNLIGACLLAVYALTNRRWAFCLECVWALVALYAIIRSYLKSESLATKNCSPATG